jgi:hypothetical protein
LVIENDLGGWPADNALRGVRQIGDSCNLPCAGAVNQEMRPDNADSMSPGACAIHNMGLEFRQFYWYRGFLRYSAKHFRLVQLVIHVAVLVGFNLRTVITIGRQRGLNPIAVSGKVVRLAGYLNSVSQCSEEALY